MYSEIASALTALKTIGELTTLLIKTSADSRVTENAIDLQSALISLQSTMLTLQSQYQILLREKDEVEKRLIDIENWEAEAEKYTLIEMVPGVFVYALKDDYKSTAPSHWLCPNCYQAKKKSILQFRPTGDGYNVFICSACKLALHDHTCRAMPS
jgi:hypothetical protein